METQLSSGWGEWTIPGQRPMRVEVLTLDDAAKPTPAPAQRRRIAAAVIDYLFLAVAALAAYTAAPAWLDTAGLRTIEFAAGVTGAVLLYFFVLETLFGQTLGKAICDVRVVDRFAGRATIGRVAVRTLLRVVDDIAFGLVGIASIALTGDWRRQRVGDIAAGTLVVRASHCHGTRPSGAGVATVGLVLVLAPLAFVASPGAESILPRSHDYEIQQASVRYLRAVAAEDTLAACRETAPAQRRAIIAANGHTYSPAGSVAECATHSADLVATLAAAYPAVAGQKLEVDRRGDAAVVSTPATDKLLALGRDGDTWKVDFLATSRAKFIASCSAPPAPADAAKVCGCAWDQIRAHGVSTFGDLERFDRRVLSNRTPAWVAQAVDGCRPS